MRGACQLPPGEVGGSRKMTVVSGVSMKRPLFTLKFLLKKRKALLTLTAWATSGEFEEITEISSMSQLLMQ